MIGERTLGNLRLVGDIDLMAGGELVLQDLSRRLENIPRSYAMGINIGKNKTLTKTRNTEQRMIK